MMKKRTVRVSEIGTRQEHLEMYPNPQRQDREIAMILLRSVSTAALVTAAVGIQEPLETNRDPSENTQRKYRVRSISVLV